MVMKMNISCETKQTSKQVVDAIKTLQRGETPVNLVTAVIAQRWITAVAVMGLAEEWKDEP